MTKEEIQKEIRETKAKIAAYKSKLNKLKKEQNEIYDIIDGLKKSIKKVDDRFNETINVVRRKSSKLSQYSKFKTTYSNEVNKILKNRNASNGIDKLQNSLNKAKKKVVSSDEEIDGYNRKISELTRKLETLKQQLNSVEEK